MGIFGFGITEYCTSIAELLSVPGCRSVSFVAIVTRSLRSGTFAFGG